MISRATVISRTVIGAAVKTTHRRRPRPPRDQGSAAVEFVTISVLLMVPLVYLAITFGRVQAATFAVDGSAREAARAFVTADNDEDGYRRAAVAVRLGLRDQGFPDPQDATLDVRCAKPTCLTPQSQVVIRVELRVGLPGVPNFLGHALATRVTVRSAATAVVDEFRTTGNDQ